MCSSTNLCFVCVILHPQQSLICCNEEFFLHIYTLTHSVNLTCQEGNNVIRMSRSLDMNPKTVGSVQSNQVIKLIIWEELYSKTYYLLGVKWLSGPQRPDGLVWLGRGGWRGACRKKEEGGVERKQGERGGTQVKKEKKRWKDKQKDEESRKQWFIHVGSHFSMFFAGSENVECHKAVQFCIVYSLYSVIVCSVETSTLHVCPSSAAVLEVCTIFLSC